MCAHTPAWVKGRLSHVHIEGQAGMKKDSGAQCGWSSCTAVPAVRNNHIPLPVSSEAIQLW